MAKVDAAAPGADKAGTARRHQVWVWRGVGEVAVVAQGQSGGCSSDMQLLQFTSWE
jgi:hypothetical protein